MADHLGFELPVTALFRLDFTVAALQRWPQNALDQWDGQCYRRPLIFGTKPHEVCVSQRYASKAPTLDVEIFAPRIAATARENTISVLQRTLGLQLDLAPFYRLAKRHPRLLALVRPFIGMRPPRFPTLHEALVSAVACQQISLPLGILLLNRLAEAYGIAVSRRHASRHAFPQPETLAQLKPVDLRTLGFSMQKARTVIGLSRLMIEGRLGPEDLENADDVAIHNRLCAVTGVGPWTADYVLLRGLGRLNIFPVNDSGALNGIRVWLGIKYTPDQKQLRRILAPWRPYAGMIYFHLLLRKLHAQPDIN